MRFILLMASKLDGKMEAYYYDGANVERTRLLNQVDSADRNERMADVLNSRKPWE